MPISPAAARQELEGKPSGTKEGCVSHLLVPELLENHREARNKVGDRGRTVKPEKKVLIWGNRWLTGVPVGVMARGQKGMVLAIPPCLGDWSLSNT